jgi:hypothetical protein
MEGFMAGFGFEVGRFGDLRLEKGGLFAPGWPPVRQRPGGWVIARLGGWTGYYGKPGPAVMRYRLDRFHAIKLGAEIAKHV